MITAREFVAMVTFSMIMGTAIYGFHLSMFWTVTANMVVGSIFGFGMVLIERYIKGPVKTKRRKSA